MQLKSRIHLVRIFVLIGFVVSMDTSLVSGKAVFQVDLAELPITFPVQSPEIADFFNQIARPQDIASFPAGFLHLMPLITKGRRMAGFPSWSAAADALDVLDQDMEFVLYNPEHWENTPIDEQERLEPTVREAGEVLHTRGKGLFLAPDRKFVDEELAELAPFADAIMLQGQRLQDDPEIFASWVREKIEIARSLNPDILIFVQVGATRGTPEQMLIAIQSVSDGIDGVAVWSTPRSLETLQTFVKLLREALPKPLTAVPSTSTPLLSSPSETSTRIEAAITLSTGPSPSHRVQASPIAELKTTGARPAQQEVSPLATGTVKVTNYLPGIGVAGFVMVIMLAIVLLVGIVKRRKPG